MKIWFVVQCGVLFYIEFKYISISFRPDQAFQTTRRDIWLTSWATSSTTSSWNVSEPRHPVILSMPRSLARLLDLLFSLFQTRSWRRSAREPSARWSRWRSSTRKYITVEIVYTFFFTSIGWTVCRYKEERLFIRDEKDLLFWSIDNRTRFIFNVITQ